MENSRLSLADFKLQKQEVSNEIEKMLGMAAADCHRTCNPDANHSTNGIDWVDWVAEAQ
jgi:hypothetical protein